MKWPKVLRVATLLTCAMPSMAAAASDAELNAARGFIKADKFSDAVTVLTPVLESDPGNQKAALLLGVAHRFAGNLDAAIRVLDQAEQVNPGTADAAQALFISAKAENLAGRPEKAKLKIQRLKKEYQESGWVPQGDLLLAEIDNRSTAALKQALDRQNAAEVAFEKAMKERPVAGEQATIEALKQIASAHVGLPIELAAREAVGNLLAETGDTSGSLEVFNGLLADLKDASPDARIVRNVHCR